MNLRVLFLAVLITAIISCASGPVKIPDDMTPPKIIQQAQEATDFNKYKVAIQYYQALMERYGNIHEYYVTAE